MSVFTFTAEMMADLTYELNEDNIWNDILLIEGAAGSEQLIRGYSAASIQKHGRRSRRIERPLAKNEATGITLVADQLDKYSCENSNPPPICTMQVQGKTDELIEQILSRTISEIVTLQQDDMGMDQNFYIDGMTLLLSTEIIKADYDLIGVAS